MCLRYYKNQNLMGKSCFTLKSLLKKTKPKKKRSIVKVTGGCCFISYQASSISLLQWMSSKIKIELFVALLRKKLKYSSVGFLRWLPSINSKSTVSIFSITTEIVLSNGPLIKSIFCNPADSKFFEAI